MCGTVQALPEDQLDLVLLAYKISRWDWVVFTSSLQGVCVCHLLYEAFTTISRHPDSKQMSELFITFPVSVYHFGYLITYYLVKLIGRLVSIYIYLPMMIISSPRQATTTCTQIIFPPSLNTLNNKDGRSHINKVPSEPEVGKLNFNHCLSS